MKIAIIDAEIVGKNKHRFPNLACMKISSFYKSQGNEVVLKTDYEILQNLTRFLFQKRIQGHLFRYCKLVQSSEFLQENDF